MNVCSVKATRSVVRMHKIRQTVEKLCFLLPFAVGEKLGI